MSTETYREIRVSRETVNDDVVKVVAWLVADGTYVPAGQTVAEIETSKTVLEVTAEAAGNIEILHPAGSEVPIGELIGRVHFRAQVAGAPAVQVPESGAVDSIGSADGASPETDTPGILISRRAQELIQRHGLSSAQFGHVGLVRESDVQRLLQGREVNSRVATTETETVATRGGELAVSQVAAPPSVAAAEPISVAVAGKSSQWSPRGLWGDARRSARDRSYSLPVLIWRYFYRNWFLGNLVRVSPRGVINFVHRRRGVKMGRDCFVDPWATLETAYPENITLGNDVRVAAGAIIMTHIKPPHHLRDTGIMPNTVKPVVLEDHCFIGVHAVVMPGVTVGKGAVVASGAVVMNNVPAYVMVAGNPAKVIKRFPPPTGDV